MEQTQTTDAKPSGFTRLKLFFKQGDYKFLGIILMIHVLLGTIHLFAYNSLHPLSKLLANLPMIFQIIIVSIYGLLAYAIPGYLIVIAIKNKSRILKSVDFALIVLFMILFITFIVLYILSFFESSRVIWMIYSFVNPLMGTFSEKLMRIHWSSILWIISAAVPSFGLLIGMYLRLKCEGVVE
ncbi:MULTISPECIES: hypothetical protein [Erysipelothrix]|uniref:Uncharacterized protein n=1 Tax=Erysipelothrix piscisicarius TaxID=2485784 RepID=A0A3S8RKZ1_9FIRM|nr:MULTISPECIES: hypothetical protein [Erysipelothrix]AZK43591.1 hypothetical protein EEI45_01155 [Erysipelothrix piscisicarius]MBK2402683.1 hypothetical protein [Erysipelothrix sp. strain 2 (EsS2-6-Brazil)]MBK2403586.1 hypothetical protein [Erysipelothrix sp. strain 2 (EsS2-7-Brazil)]NBA02047.1 hypothetical protein [Erysipelothrix rhusiopathiae]